MDGPSDVVFLTGATGFVGRHIARELLGAGYGIKVLVRPNEDGNTDANRLPEDVRPHVAVVGGDVREAGFLVDELRSCRYLIHVAGLYSFAPKDRRAVWDTNVRGTASMLEAARIAGVERAVVTSSSATVGPARDGRLATEADWARSRAHRSDYHQSKIEQERRALAAQIPTVVLLPTAPVGPEDIRPTPTGKAIVDFMAGRIFATLRGGLNVVAVEDVARAHVAALRRGKQNERYIIGGANLSLAELFGILARIMGRDRPRFELPYPVAYGLGLLDDARCRLRPMAQPLVPLEGVRMGHEFMFVSSRKAESELDVRPGSVMDALGRAVAWFRDHGYA